MLTHQIEFSKAVAEIYKPISGRMSDPDSFHDEGNQAGIEACAEYEGIVKELQETLKPELEPAACPLSVATKSGGRAAVPHLVGVDRISGGVSRLHCGQRRTTSPQQLSAAAGLAAVA